jgi:hypothetical protein
MEPEEQMTRKKKTVAGLLQSERHLLLTGDCTPPRGDWRDYGEGWVRPFTLVSPAGREELEPLWLAHRDELMAEWKSSGKRGKPWAAKIFDM